MIVPGFQLGCSDGSGGGLGSGGRNLLGCAGNCPLRVDPNAPNTGSGQSWQDPQNDVQAALDEQSAKGGGEVWVLGGEFATLQAAQGTLLRFPSHVALRGGFLGVEASPEERQASAPATVLRSTGAAAALFQIAGQSDVTIDRLRLVDGSPAFSIEDSQGIRVSDVIVVVELPATMTLRKSCSLKILRLRRTLKSVFDVMGGLLGPAPLTIRSRPTATLPPS